MAEIVRLEKITFDNYENDSPWRCETVGVFVAGDGLTAHGKLSAWFEEQAPIRLYLGYDGEVYPRFVATTERVL